MDNTKDDRYFLKKIIDDITFVLTNTKDMTFEEFDEDEIINSAVNFKFIQISENASRLSSSIIQNNTEIPWNKIKGMRNRIVHDYDNVFFDAIYKTIKRDLPVLLEQLSKLIETI